MKNQIVIIKLFQQLFKRMANQSKVFDRYQIGFLERLHLSPSQQATDKLFKECIEQLKTSEIPLEKTLSEGRLVVSQSQLQLQKIDLSVNVLDKIAKVQSTPYSIIEHHRELTDMIKIYQRVVIELDKKTVSHNDEQLSLYQRAYNELQNLILNLDIGDDHIKKLDDIRQQMTVNDPLKLPEYCISIIAIIIDSTRDERRSSRNFLYTLNESLSQFYLNFTKKIKHAEDFFDEQELCIQTIQKKSTRLKDSAKQATDIELLRSNIFAYVENVENLISIKNKEKDIKVQQQLQSMKREIKELQDETKGYQTTLKQQSTQLHLDFLTKVPNRASWSERLENEYNRYKRYKNPLSIAVIDIDKFKKINDAFGHLAGDKVLTVIAQTLSKSLRSVDFIARYGGEEFAVLLPEINHENAYIALEKLRNKIKNIPFKFKKNKIGITISIGYASFTPSDDLNSAFDRADQALYHAKNNGRNKTVFFAQTPEIK